MVMLEDHCQNQIWGWLKMKIYTQSVRGWCGCPNDVMLRKIRLVVWGMVWQECCEGIIAYDMLKRREFRGEFCGCYS